MGARVVIIDADPITRRALSVELEPHGFVIAAACTDTDAGLAALLRHETHLCLLDTRVPEGSIRAIRRLRQAAPTTRVIVLADRIEARDLLAALRAGADGYLERGVAIQQLARSLHAAMEGEPAIPRRAVTHLLEQFRRPHRRVVSVPGRGEVELTLREWEILRLLREGKTTSGIAAELYIAEVTVRTHVASILRRLHVPDRASAIELVADP